MLPSNTPTQFVVFLPPNTTASFIADFGILLFDGLKRESGSGNQQGLVKDGSQAAL
ncbi:hypothetical protein [Propionivibrio limicola]|uniref:hypothetical protein n=1 Tax=Propionivibrio limicola TaxID=167645 RepID=UPI001292A2EE|nr:hypothetical protein [Propionivibrio limicola]